MKKKYFGTDGIRGYVGKYPINAEFALKLGWALGKVINQDSKAKVLIGKDTRISGYLFESALQAGLASAGVNIRLLGPMPTPAIAYLTRTLRAQAGIVISASHNLYYDNGIKFFSSDGFKLPDEMELAIEAYLEQPMTTVDSSQLGNIKRIVDAGGRYIEFCKSTVSNQIHFNGMKIILDCANGATYHVAPNIFRELGAEVIEISSSPNGFNINDNCGSTNPQLLQKLVIAEQAHLGIALDGDGDRVIMIDNKGEIVDGDELVYIIAKNRVQKGKPLHGVVGTLMTNLGLELALKDMHIDFTRTPVGDRYVIAEMKNRGWQLGGESSGHIICMPATTTGDGIISALQVLETMANHNVSLYELKSGMRKFPQVMLNIKTHKANEAMQDKQLQLAVQSAEQELAGRGRVLLRPSGTEPLFRVMVEGEELNQVQKIAMELASMVESITL